MVHASATLGTHNICNGNKFVEGFAYR